MLDPSLALACLCGGLVIDFDGRFVTERPNDLVGSGHDPIALFEARSHFDVCRARNAGNHFSELRFVVRRDHKDSLDLFLLSLLGRLIGRSGAEEEGIE